MNIEFPNARLIRYRDRETWLSARKNVVTATAADLLILGRYEAIKKKKLTPFVDNIYTALGRAVEPVIISEAAKRLKEEITHGENTLWLRRDNPRVGASLDGWTVNGTVIEAKSNWSRNAWPDSDKLPRAYWMQVQWQLWVTGASRGVVACLMTARETGSLEFQMFSVHPHEKIHEVFAKRVSKCIALLDGENVPDDPPAVNMPEHIDVAKEPGPARGITISDDDPLKCYVENILKSRNLLKQAEELKPRAVERLRELEAFDQPVSFEIQTEGRSVRVSLERRIVTKEIIPQPIKNLYTTGVETIDWINIE